MKVMEEVLRYGAIKKGEVYKREELEKYVEKYRCMLIESGAQRGILSCNLDDEYRVLDVIENVGGNFFLGKTVVCNKFFEEAIIVKKA